MCPSCRRSDYRASNSTRRPNRQTQQKRSISKAEAGLIQFFIKWSFIAFLVLSGFNYLTGGNVSKSIKPVESPSAETDATKFLSKSNIGVAKAEDETKVINVGDLMVNGEAMTAYPEEMAQPSLPLQSDGVNENTAVDIGKDDLSSMPNGTSADNVAAPIEPDGEAK